MKYIHVPGCDCTSSTDYAERREAAIQHAALRDGLTDGLVRENSPRGSCLSWLTDEHRGHGWPFAHTDQELLRLHTAALAERTEKASGYTEYSDRSERDYARRDALAAAIAAAPWGAQPDGSFVTRRSQGVSTMDRIHTLHAPNKGGPIAEARDGAMSSVSLCCLRTREEAATIRLTERARNRVAALELTSLRDAIDDAVRLGSWLWYEPGVEGGTVRLLAPMSPSSPYAGQPASARGACKRAGVDPKALPLAAAWLRIGSEMRTADEAVVLDREAVEPRVSDRHARLRRLPVNDQRRAAVTS